MLDEEPIDRIIIAEGKARASLKRTICQQCGRLYFMKLAKDGSVVQPCPICLGVFGDGKGKPQRRAPQPQGLKKV